MIGFLSGTVKFNFGGEIILDVNGVGYRIFTAGDFETGEAAKSFFIANRPPVELTRVVSESEVPAWARKQLAGKKS